VAHDIVVAYMQNNIFKECKFISLASLGTSRIILENCWFWLYYIIKWRYKN
jgi:hypothetical protein